MIQHLSISAPVFFDSGVGDKRVHQRTSRPTSRKCPSFAMISTMPNRLISMPSPSETCSEGHAMCIVGYLDAKDRANLFSGHLVVTRRRQAAGSPFDVPTAPR